MASTIETAALDRMLEAVGRCLTPESAQHVVELRADPALQARLDELADKSTAGTLTDDERSEYETYVRALDFITILQNKARAALQKAAS
jgi:hypothetical protein